MPLNIVNDFFNPYSMKLSVSNIAVIVLGVLLCLGCGPKVPYSGKGKWTKIAIKSSIFSKGNTGFVLYDLEKEKCLANYQGNKKFTPASNTKLLTLLAAKQVLGEELIVINYLEKSDSLLLRPSGFPGFNYINNQGSTALDSLLINIKKPVKLILPQSPAPYGAGWSWDDSGYSYQVPRSLIPIFGNRLTKNKAYPNSFYADSILIKTPDFSHFNNQYIQSQPGLSKSSIPFFPDTNFIMQHLWKNGKLDIVIEEKQDRPELEQFEELRIAAFPFYQAVLKDSDNFIAEQLLLMISNQKENTWNTNSVTSDYFTQQFDGEKLAWVDGSGLSRYNALSPEQIVRALQLLIEVYGIEDIKRLLPAAGAEGTLKNHYKRIPSGHLFAKTGTLRHIHCLSGLLLTASGKPLIFSFMHNQIPGSNGPWKAEMEQKLLEIYNKY